MFFPRQISLLYEIVCLICHSTTSKRQNATKKSRLKYILTTTHVLDKDFSNVDRKTGDFRLIDIFKEPICFRGPVLEGIADSVGCDTLREMCLLSVHEL